MNDPSALATGLGLVALLALVVAVVALQSAHSERLRIVSANSKALMELDRINGEFRARLPLFPVLRYNFHHAAKSKREYERYDLQRYFLSWVASDFQHLEQEIGARIAAQYAFTQYEHAYATARDTHLGASSAPNLEPSKFLPMESKLFSKRKLRAPVCAAAVTCSVTYTSPGGQNRYGPRSLSWDWAGLEQSLRHVAGVRAQQSTTAFLRQQERDRMTTFLRADILRRDGYRCQHCGARASDGIVLHVDHVVPVSKGGKTDPANLQTLCQDCNLGKSNRF